MALSLRAQAKLEVDRDINRNEKIKPKKLTKKLEKSFDKLNNRALYSFFTDTENKSYHNLMDFLGLLEKRCEEYFGKQKKYSKSDVGCVVAEFLPSPTPRQVKTLIAINKAIKKCDTDEMLALKFKKVFDEKAYSMYNKNSEDYYE